ncbi:MAG: hypothetical protein KDK48_04405 [Chlamydiia bacterium]|nr:hypothetical protein [Chlamydiia bacterium]
MSEFVVYPKFQEAFLNGIKTCSSFADSLYQEVPAAGVLSGLGVAVSGTAGAVAAAPVVAIAAKKALTSLTLELTGVQNENVVVLIDVASSIVIFTVSAVALTTLTSAPVILTFTLGALTLHTTFSATYALYKGIEACEIIYLIEKLFFDDFDVENFSTTFALNQAIFFEFPNKDWDQFQNDFKARKAEVETFQRLLTAAAFLYELTGMELLPINPGTVLKPCEEFLEAYNTFESEVIGKPYDPAKIFPAWIAFGLKARNFEAHCSGASGAAPSSGTESKTLKSVMTEMTALAGNYLTIEQKQMMQRFILQSGTPTRQMKCKVSLIFHPDCYKGPHQEKIAELYKLFTPYFD